VAAGRVVFSVGFGAGALVAVLVRVGSGPASGGSSCFAIAGVVTVGATGLMLGELELGAAAGLLVASALEIA
jgi:hypothetical protein